MLDPFPIVPFNRPAAASVRLPGSKSITNRALLLAALCEGETVLKGALFSEDTEIMVGALRQLGFSIDADPAGETIRIRGEGGRIPNREATLFVGNAGTAARFLTALCCLAREGTYQIDGVAEMRKRPMKGLIDALSGFGANIESEDGHFPLRIQANGLAGGRVEVDAAASSQMLSALLMVAPFARADCTFSVRQVRLPFVSMTLRMMEQFGQKRTGANLLRQAAREITIPAGAPYRQRAGGSYRVEADVTAASYFATLPVVTGGFITIENLLDTDDGLQGDAAFFEVLREIGCQIDSDHASGTRFTYPESPPTKPLAVDFSSFSDTFLTLAAVSPLLKAPIRIRGIAHTRKQETDRVAGMARELRKLGQQVIEHDDALEILPSMNALKQQQIHVIETYRDHRFAMSFALLGLFDLHRNGQPWIALRDPKCCAKTFPDFFRVLESVRERSHDVRVG